MIFWIWGFCGGLYANKNVIYNQNKRQASWFTKKSCSILFLINSQSLHFYQKEF
jgi:hypothetical protein